MNKKGLVGLVVLLVAVASLIFSGRSIVSDVDLQVSLSKMSDTVDTHGKQIADLTARLEKLEARPVGKTIASQATSLPKLSTAKVGITSAKGEKNSPVAGQTVYLNATGTKYHFWDGCTWFGYGTEATLETVPEGCQPCMLCQMKKVIAQK